MSILRRFAIALGAGLGASLAAAQNPAAQSLSDALLQEPGSLGEGWRGFTDVAFLVNATLTLTLAALLGAIIAYHPKHRQTADTLQEIEAPKVYIMYSVIGAIVGIMVVKYGLVVGFVLFGVGGLIRFRTMLRSAILTGNVILVTLIGLSCGLDLPHVAALATAFGFVLIYVLEARITYRISVRGMPGDGVAKAAAAYRSVLQQHGGHILSERKNPAKGRFRFIFRCSHEMTQERLSEIFAANIDPELKGSVDWEID